MVNEVFGKMLGLLRRYYFVVIVVAAIIVKCIMTINLPINPRDPVGADEYLMMEQAEQLVAGNYLGPYNYLTLVKGIGFPLFLAFSYKIGCSLLLLYSIFYAGACLIALIPIRRMIKKKTLQLIVFLLLLFCPATMDGGVQLIYRNMLILPQSMLLVSALMMMYFHINDEKKKKLIWWSLLASFTWVFMWHTREDSIWSVPLLVGAWIVMGVAVIKEKKTKILSKPVLNKIGVIALPFLMLFISTHIISFINYQHYGVYMTNQLNESNYTKAVMLMMKIKPTEEIERVEITRETLQRLYEVSPTFAELEDEIEKDYEDKIALVMAGDDNGEIDEDLITWELMGAANAKGYYKDAQTAERFWGDVYSEIKQAVDEGKLETRATLPSRSLIPFPTKEGSFARLIESIGSLYIRAVKYESSNPNVDVLQIDESIAERYEAISGGYVVSPNDFELNKKAERWVIYANRVKKIYAAVGIPWLIISLVYYVGLTVRMTVRLIKKKIHCLDQRFIFLTAILGGATVMLIGLGYVNAFMVNVYGYLSSVNALLNFFMVLALGFLIQDAMRVIPKYFESKDLK